MMKLPSELLKLILLYVMHEHKVLWKMNCIWNVMISWLLWQFLIHVIPVQSYKMEITIPVSSPIKLECNEDFKVNNIEVAIRKSNTSCRTTFEECALPLQTIGTITEECTKQESCEVDINITKNVTHCLNEYGFFNVWYTCKNILDFSCDFESDLCNWSPEHDNTRFRWEHGNRLYYYDTPPMDHTSGTTAGKYVYIYASWSQNGDVAYLKSGQILSMNQQCLSFWFFTTNSRDSVYVYQNNKLLLNLTNYAQDKWHHKQTSIGMSDNSYTLVFKVIRENRRNTYFGAIVIDDILIENQECDSAILKCDFDSYSCDWKNGDSNQNSWKKQNAEPLWGHTGPSTDHSTASNGGKYMYLEGNIDTTAYLELHNIDVPGRFCFTFWYHMYNYKDFEMERLNVTFDNELVWTDYANTNDKWKKARINLYNRKKLSISFIGILRRNQWNDIDIAIDDIYLAEGTCEGYLYHEEMCVPIDEKTPKETQCPKGYLKFANLDVLFDPEKKECSKIYNQTKNRLLKECKKRNDSETCLIDLSTDTSAHPECFQLYDFHIIHTCEDEEPTSVSTVITSKSYSSADDKSTTVLSDITSRGKTSLGLAVGLVIGALLVVCAVIGIIFLIRRHSFNESPRAKIGNNLRENDYIGSQDIASPLTANHSIHLQNTDIYNGSSDTTNANAHINNVEPEYTNVGAVNGFVNKNKVTVPTYAHHQDTVFADNHIQSDDEYAIVDPTAETSFNDTMNNRTGTADSYMVLDPTQTGFNRQICSNTPVGYEFAKPVNDTNNKIGDDDQYAISDGVYDHSGNNRHKESEDYIYNHAVDTIYDSGSHKRKEEVREDTYDHFIGQKTEDDYDISTTT